MIVFVVNIDQIVFGTMLYTYVLYVYACEAMPIKNSY